MTIDELVKDLRFRARTAETFGNRPRAQRLLKLAKDLKSARNNLQRRRDAALEMEQNDDGMDDCPF